MSHGLIAQFEQRGLLEELPEGVVVFSSMVTNLDLFEYSGVYTLGTMI